MDTPLGSSMPAIVADLHMHSQALSLQCRQISSQILLRPDLLAIRAWHEVTLQGKVAYLAARLEALQKKPGLRADSIWHMGKERLVEVAVNQMGWDPPTARRETVGQLRLCIREFREAQREAAEEAHPHARLPPGLARLSRAELQGHCKDRGWATEDDCGQELSREAMIRLIRRHTEQCRAHMKADLAPLSDPLLPNCTGPFGSGARQLMSLAQSSEAPPRHSVEIGVGMDPESSGISEQSEADMMSGPSEGFTMVSSTAQDREHMSERPATTGKPPSVERLASQVVRCLSQGQGGHAIEQPPRGRKGRVDSEELVEAVFHRVMEMMAEHSFPQ